MTPTRFSALIGGLLMAAAAFAPGAAQAATDRITFKVGDERRSATISERARLKRQLRPVLIVLPTTSGRNATLARRSARFEQFANRGGILVQAEPLKGAWRPGPDGVAAELDYLRALVREVTSRTLANPRRIYIVGVGGGGMVALQAACRDARLYAGVTAILAALPEPAAAACAPGKALPAQLVVGTADKNVPIGGGPSGVAEYKGSFASAEASLAPFAAAAGCSDKRTRTPLADRDRNDASRVVTEQYEGCKAPIRIARIEGGGHVLPSLAGGQRVTGQNRDVSVRGLTLSFFRLPGV
ncbi:MAG TPA: hypothetical protein VIL72_06780 [Beijerinckiaceae bacterium]|jgi:polyhydroxybutyrate depolymerase